MEARTQASVALFKLGAHSPLRSDPNLEGLEVYGVVAAQKGGGAAAPPQARTRSGSTLAIRIHAKKLTVGAVGGGGLLPATGSSLQ